LGNPVGLRPAVPGLEAYASLLEGPALPKLVPLLLSMLSILDNTERVEVQSVVLLLA
jgi:hypothetical protein